MVEIYEWQPVARRHWHSARQLTASLLPINRMLAPPYHQVLPDPTTAHEYVGRFHYLPSCERQGPLHT
jgi:hypothetical protein